MTTHLTVQHFLDGEGSTAGTSILGGRRIRDVEPKIALLGADQAPMTALLSQLRKYPCTDPKIEWQEDVFPAVTDTITATSSTDASVTATTAALWRAGDLWFNGDSGEVILVTANSSGSLTVVRGVGDTDAQDIATADNWFYIANASETGSQARAKLTTQITQPYNYCQLFKESFEVTGTLNATKLYGGPDLKYLRYKHAQIHQRDKERSLWFGVRSKTVGTTGVTYTSKGLVGDATGDHGFITTNESVSNSTGAYSETTFDTDLQTAFRYGSDTKFMFASPMALSTVSSWGRSSIRDVPRADTWGIAITRYISPHGELNIVNEKMLYDYSTAGTGGTWPAVGSFDLSKMAVILDLKNVYMRTLRDTQLEMGIQENDRDSIEDQYMTECGLQVVNQETCMAIYGFDIA
ncbi:MAG: DUF5309 family protein [Pseudomonadota bacterium]